MLALAGLGELMRYSRTLAAQNWSLAGLGRSIDRPLILILAMCSRSIEHSALIRADC